MASAVIVAAVRNERRVLPAKLTPVSVRIIDVNISYLLARKPRYAVFAVGEEHQRFVGYRYEPKLRARLLRKRYHVLARVGNDYYIRLAANQFFVGFYRLAVSFRQARVVKRVFKQRDVHRLSYRVRRRRTVYYRHFAVKAVFQRLVTRDSRQVKAHEPVCIKIKYLGGLKSAELLKRSIQRISVFGIGLRAVAVVRQLLIRLLCIVRNVRCVCSCQGKLRTRGFKARKLL